MERHLTTILVADVVAYSSLMGADEAGTITALKTHRSDLIDPKAAQYHGRTVKLMGDGALMEFGSVVDAVAFAVEVQTAMRARNAEVPEDRQIVFRIGINIGDIIVEGDDIYGDGVNIAARLEGLAEPGGICVRRNVRNQVRDKLDLDFEDLGEIEVKNIARPVRVFRVILDDKAATLATPVLDMPAEPARGRWPAIAAGLALSVVAVAVIVGAALRFWPASSDDLPPLPSGPKIAIIPFVSLGGDDDNAQLAAGLTEDIAATLSRFSNFFVLSLNATEQYKGQSVDPRRIKEELGAQYVLEGSVRRSKTNLRVVAKLLDARNAQRLWTQTYDRDLTATDIFAVLDEVTEGVVATIGSNNGVIRLKESQLVRGRRTESLEAYECVALEAWFATTLSQEARTTVRTCLERTVKFSPNYSKAWSTLANILLET